MTGFQYAYSVSSNVTPFSTIPGGFMSFCGNVFYAEVPQKDGHADQIIWTLRDSSTNETFCACQDVSNDHATLYSALLSERPLKANQTYETVSVSVPASLSDHVKRPDETSLCTKNRLGVARGTHVMTARGEVKVENLCINDRVITRDHGLQPVRWIGQEKRTISAKNAPILIRQGAMKNARDLIVSADHRLVVKGAKAMMNYGVKEVLIPASNLANGETILPSVGGTVDFFQIVTDQHEVIYFEAAAGESFLPDEQGLKALNTQNAAEIHATFHQFNDAADHYGPTVRGFVEAVAY